MQGGKHSREARKQGIEVAHDRLFQDLLCGNGQDAEDGDIDSSVGFLRVYYVDATERRDGDHPVPIDEQTAQKLVPCILCTMKLLPCRFSVDLPHDKNLK